MKQSKWSLKYPSVLSGLSILIICLISLILPYPVKAALTGTNFPITTAASTQDRPAIASDGANYLVVYQSGVSGTGTGIDIYGVILNSGGGVVTGPFVIDSSTGDQSFPSVAYNSGSNNYLVVYQTSTGLNNILGNYVSNTGTVGSVLSIAASGTLREEIPSVAADG